ncbi:MAG: serine hydrolase domain-containing protein [Cyclobacteriaceae bacterium]
MRHLIIFVLVFAYTIVAGQRLDSARTLSFMDGLLQAKMHDEHIAGATLAIVQDGKVLFSKGYGYADLAKRTPVDPASTLFRIGSISKLFVWTSIMQLHAQGKVDLDADINQYMKNVNIPEAFGKPITLRHLLTHTPGFEDHVMELFGRDSTSLKPLGDLLRQQMPARVRAPFTEASYSNHGTAMAAYIVEKVSGMDFNDYIETHIMQPLGMTRTTFRQPLPGAFKAHMSKGYQVKNNEPVEQSFEYVPLYPVGAAASTAEDMTRLMLAYLNHGKSGDAEVLDSATLALMMSPAHRHHEEVNPMRYGFMDVSQNGETLIGHGGDTFWFHSGFFFLPEHNAGLFLSFNTDKGGGVYMDVVEAFMDEYFPDQRPLPPALDMSKEWLSQFAGEYMVNRYSYDDLLKIASLGGRLQISAADGKLKLVTDNNTKYYVPIDSVTFREEYKNDRFVFEKNADGEVVHGYLGLLPILAFDKVGGLDRSSLHNILAIIVVISTLAALLYWPIIAWVRRGYRPNNVASKTIPGLVKTVAWANYFFLLLFLLLFASATANPFDLVFGIPTTIKVALIFPFLMIATTLLMFVFLFRLFLDTDYKLRSRLYYLLLCLVSVAALWQLNYWNFLGFNY